MIDQRSNDCRAPKEHTNHTLTNADMGLEHSMVLALEKLSGDASAS